VDFELAADNGLVEEQLEQVERKAVALGILFDERDEVADAQAESCLDAGGGLRDRLGANPRPNSSNRFSGSCCWRLAFASANALPRTVASMNLERPASALARALRPISTS
jgi:hypothetical protein